MDDASLRAAAAAAHLARHHALLVVSEEALELSHLDTVDGQFPEVDFGALERALAEAKRRDEELRGNLAMLGEELRKGGDGL